MRNTICGAILVAVPISACGDRGGVVRALQAPSPPPLVATAPPFPEPEPLKRTLIDLQKQAVAAARAAMNTHDAKKYSELFAPDATVDEYGLGEAKGRKAIAGGIQGAFDGFSDYKIGASKIFVKNEVLVQEWVITGTNNGEFNGAKPTDKPVGVRGASVLTFTPEGLIKTEHRYFDTSTVLSQLGLMKEPARPVAALPKGEPEWHIAKGTAEEDKLVEVAKALNGAFEKKSEADFLGALCDNPAWSDFAAPQDLIGQASAKQVFRMFTNAFPDAKRTYHSLFAADDTVISEWSFTATHAGRFGLLKPTKKSIALHVVDIMRVKDGKVQSGSSYSNSFELLVGDRQR
jgi:ketosteroid isomerase-like protein